MNDIIELLDQLAELQDKRAARALGYEERRQELLTPELRELEAERDTDLGDIDYAIAGLEAEIKESTIAFGETIKGSYRQAVYQSGTVTWDKDGLDLYARLHPEIVQYRRQGKPFIKIIPLRGR